MSPENKVLVSYIDEDNGLIICPICRKTAELYDEEVIYESVDVIDGVSVREGEAPCGHHFYFRCKESHEVTVDHNGYIV